MSILLDSLSQQNEKNNQDNTDGELVPNLNVSHFDDEVLSDEWIIKRAKQWKSVALLCIGLLILSWGYFLYHGNINNNQNEHKILPTLPTASTESSNVVKKQEIKKSVVKQNTITNSQKTEFAENSKKTAESTLSALPVSQVKKQKYNPQKRIPITKSKTQKQKIKQIEPTKITEPAVPFEELSLQEQEDFPKIKVDSYVISDNREESFVILDNKIYKINQLINSDLILREINKKNIILEYQSKLVKIPLSQ